MRESKKRLFRLFKEKALFKGKVTLSSGKVSNYYVDGRLITLSAKGAYLVADIILDLVVKKRIKAVGGPTIGADPIVGAVAAMSHIRKRPISAFIVRKSAKKHGRMRWIEGPALKKNSRVLLVDDVATTGSALIEARKVLAKEAIIANEAIVVIDRQEGAKENLAKAGLKLSSIFKAEDFNL